MTDDGHVGILVAPSNPLHVRGSATDQACMIENNHVTAPEGLIIDYSSAAPNGTSQEFIILEDSAAVRLKVVSNGDVYTTSGTDIQAISDERLKKDIVDYTDGLTVLNSLKPRTFKWKDSERYGSGKQYGFIAQEIKASDFIDDNMKLSSYLAEDDLYATQLSAKEAILISAIQELSAKVTALENA